jgi:hypothetical protein
MRLTTQYYMAFALAALGALGATPARAEAWQERVFVQPTTQGNWRKDLLLIRPDGTQWQIRPGMGCRAALMLGSEDPDEQYTGVAWVRASAGNPFNNITRDNYDFISAILLLPQSPMGMHFRTPVHCRILSIERISGNTD